MYNSSEKNKKNLKLIGHRNTGHMTQNRDKPYGFGLITSTLYDPVLSDDGTLDPLGLASIADRLGNRLVPGVRERMRHPRFLTAIAAGARVCEPFEGAICADGYSEPFQVYEWIIVQALYRTYRDDPAQYRGMPGTLKAQEAYKNRDSLSRNRYLKNAYTFGFHGVYRTLAETLDIATDGILGEKGDRLLRTWEEEQNMDGFLSGNNGAGRILLDKLQKLLRNSIDSGEVAANWNSNFWSELAPLFAPYKAGPKEKQLIRNLIVDDKVGFRDIFLDKIPEYYKTLEPDQDAIEKKFHDYLMATADKELNELLDTIQTYEKFALAVHNCFYDILAYLSDKNRRVPLAELEQNCKHIPNLASLQSSISESRICLEKFGQALFFEENFEHLICIQIQQDIIPAIIKHHRFIQESKPPNGKMPWLEEFPNQQFMIRPAHKTGERVMPVDQYVNSYRLYSLINFHKDLT